MSGWTIPLDKLAEKVQLDLETVARKSTMDVFTAVALRSPVDTGRFRANWNVSYGAPDLSVTDSTDSARAVTEARKALTLPVGGVVYMCNSLPYAPVIEYGLYPNPPKNPTGKTVGGYSRQAPQGVVRVTAVEYNDYVQKAIHS
jgi:hypothetical protein